jgi:PGF-CTERM protein
MTGASALRSLYLTVLIVTAVVAGVSAFTGTAAAAGNSAPDCSTVDYNDADSDGKLDVDTVDRLQCIQNEGLDKDYELTSDIDASETSEWNSGDGFDPIGGYSSPFTGTFDGQGHSISGLTIARDGTDYVGLFAIIGNLGEVRNVVLAGEAVTGENFVGGVAGRLDSQGEVENVGLDGGSIDGYDSVGGLVGKARNFATVTNSYVSSDVTSSYPYGDVGGLVGWNVATVSNVYMSGDVTGGSDGEVGGIVGYQNGGTVERAFVTGDVASSSGSVGGLVGEDNSGTVQYAYWDKGTTNQGSAVGSTDSTTTTGLTGFGSTGDTKPAPKMQGSSASSDSNMGDLDFTSTWETVEAGGDATADGYPILTGLDRQTQLESQGIYNQLPSVDSVTRVDSTPTNADSVQYDVTFSESASNVDTGDFTVNGDASGTVASVGSSSGTTIRVTVDSISGDGEIRLDVDSSVTYTNGQTYTIDNTEPSISSVGITDDIDGNGVVSDGDTVQVTATVTDANAITTVEADASAFDTDTVTLSDDGPNSASGDDQYSATFSVGSSPTEGTQSVTVDATDGAGNGGSQGVVSGTLSVDTTDPEFSSGTTASIDEGTTGNVIDVEAGDDGTSSPDTNVDYSLGSASGSDADDFSIDSSTGQITLDSQTDFETPGDSDTNNDYELTVTAEDDGGNSKEQSITVSITDVNEQPTLDTNDGVTVEEASSANVISSSRLAASDPEQSADSITYDVTTTVSHGTLFVDGNGTGTDDGTRDGEVPLSTGTFTQADLDDGNLMYTHDGSETSGDSFEFDLDDGTNTVAGNTFTITVNPVNDAPTLSASTADPTFTEDGSAVTVFSSANADVVESSQQVERLELTVSNVADGSAETLTVDGSDVALTDGNSLTTADHGLSVSVAVSSGTATVTIDEGPFSEATANTIVDDLAYEHTGDDPSTANDRTITLTKIVDDGGTSNGGDDTTTLSTSGSVSITARNDAPTMSTDTRSLTAIDEDDTTNGGTTVSSILGSAGSTSDAEGDTLGVAVTGVDDTDGTWEYSTDGGTSWQTVSSASPASDSALVLEADDHLRFVPNDDYSGSVSGSVTIRAWDRTSGSPGDTDVDASTAGGTTAFSTSTAKTTVTVRDAPEVSSITRTGTDPTNANSVDFDVTFDEPVSGVDTDDFSIKPVTGDVSGSVSDVSGSGASYTVTVGSITGDGELGLALTDDDTITSDSASVPLGGVGTTGDGDGSFTAGETVIIDNTNPSTSDDSGTVDEGSGATTLISDVHDNDDDDTALTVSKVDGSSGNVGTAITGDGGGEFTVSSDGTVSFDTSDDFDSLGGGDSATTRVTITVEDEIGHTATSTVTATVDGKNDAPTMSTDTRSLTAIDEDDTGNDGTTVSSILGSAGTTSDAEGDTLGVAVTDVDDTDGTWEYSTDGGTSWQTVSSASPASDSALVLEADDHLRFVPNDDYSGSVSGSVTIRAWDRTSGSPGDTDVDASTAGGTTAFSTSTAKTTVTVRDAPEVSSITRTGTDPTNANSVDFDVTFDEPVSGVDTDDFSIKPVTGDVSGSVSDVSGSGASYTVTVGSITGDGELGLELTDDDTITSDSASVPLGGVGRSDGAGDGSYTSGETFTVDNTAPSVSTASLVAETGGSDAVSDGSTVQITATVTDANAISSVEADASGFDTGTVTLADDGPNSTAGDDRYSATFGVGSNPSVGDQPVTVSATDAVGNGGSQNVGPNSLTVDLTEPTISAFGVSNPSGQDVRISFESDEHLSTITATVGGAESATLARSDFTESGSGPYTYTATYDGSSDGTYDVVLDAAEDAASNDGASSQSDSASVSTGPKASNDDAPPSADAGENVTVKTGDLVSFDGSASSDDTGITRYEWDFDGDGDADHLGDSGTERYDEAGTYEVILTVSDAFDKTDTDTVTVTVTDDSAQETTTDTSTTDPTSSTPPVTTDTRTRTRTTTGPPSTTVTTTGPSSTTWTTVTAGSPTETTVPTTPSVPATTPSVPATTPSVPTITATSTVGSSTTDDPPTTDGSSTTVVDRSATEERDPVETSPSTTSERTDADRPRETGTATAPENGPNEPTSTSGPGFGIVGTILGLGSGSVLVVRKYASVATPSTR